MEYEYKEVDYHQYCHKCKYYGVSEVKDPCNNCLGEPANLHSVKPVYYEEKKR